MLLVIDIQDRLVPAMKYGEQVIQNTNTLISVAKKLGVPIIDLFSIKQTPQS